MAESPILIYSGVILDLKLSEINKVVIEDHLGGGGQGKRIIFLEYFDLKQKRLTLSF